MNVSFLTSGYFFSQLNGGIPAPVFWQITSLAVLTGLLSILLSRLLRIKSFETTFQSAFRQHLADRQKFKLCPNQRLRDFLYQASDQGINQEFNTYLAKRFVQQSSAYILPILLALFWLDQTLPATGYVPSMGKPFIMRLPWEEYGIPGLPFPLLFLTAYIITLTCGIWLTRKGRKTYHQKDQIF